MDSDWVFLCYKLHDDLENMIIPPEQNKPREQWRAWIVYAAYFAWKYYFKGPGTGQWP